MPVSPIHYPGDRVPVGIQYKNTHPSLPWQFRVGIGFTGPTPIDGEWAKLEGVLQPGETANLTLDVVIPEDAPLGDYQVDVRVWADDDGLGVLTGGTVGTPTHIIYAPGTGKLLQQLGQNLNWRVPVKEVLPMAEIISVDII